MNSRSLRRNIISDHFVQPYTKNFDDGACDYSVARDSDLKVGNLNYYNRPQNYETQMGLSQADMKGTSANSKVDQAYNLAGSDLPSLNSATNQKYYPYAYGGNLDGQTGAGVMGSFAPHDAGVSGKPSGYFEPYKFRSNNQLGAGNELRLQRATNDGSRTYEATNFGQFNKSSSVNTNPSRYASSNAGLSYQTVNPARRSYAGSQPRFNKGNRGMSALNEGFRVQSQPREGFFFESGLYPVNNAGSDYDGLGEFSLRTSDSLNNSITELNTLISNIDAKTLRVQSRINVLVGDATGDALTAAVAALSENDQAKYGAFTREITFLANRKAAAQRQKTNLQAIIESPDQNLVSGAGGVVGTGTGGGRSAEDQAILNANKLLN
tara:strand:- start:55 stop:1194 length:1140 start_codon:yes stop_codon:yes gene_type:complete